MHPYEWGILGVKAIALLLAIGRAISSRLLDINRLLHLQTGGQGAILTGVGFLQLGGVTNIKGIDRSVRQGTPTLQMNGSIVE